MMHAQEGKVPSDETSPTLSSAKNGGDEEAAERQQHMLETITRQSSLMEQCIREINTLLAKLSSKSTKKIPLKTRLPIFIRALEKDHETATWLASELETPQLDDISLTTISRKFDSCSTKMRQSTLQWDVLKRCHSVLSINQTFQGSAQEDRRKELSNLAASGREKALLHRALKEQAKVDVHVVDGGAEWLDIKTLQEDRLARQMTDSGWGWGDHDVGDVVSEDEWEDVILVKQVKRLVTAAKMNRHEYRFPRVRVVLPNLSRENPDFAVLFDQMTRIDPLVELIIEDRAGTFLNSSPLQLEVALENMMVDEFAALTQTLNMDHTILVDLISDLTHLRLEPQPWQAPTTRAQIEQEKQTGGHMVRILYPVLQGRTLVCTREAAEHFHEVLETVGTETERLRGRLLVPWDEEALAMPDVVIRSRLQSLSVHELPPSIQVPIRIIDEEWGLEAIRLAIEDRRLPQVALDVARCGMLKSSKLSIYTYGWAKGLATVTSNKEVYGQMKTWIEGNRHSEEERGPVIWRVDATRNLLAKSAMPPEGFENGGRNRPCGQNDEGDD